jgi:DNA processing protein
MRVLARNDLLSRSPEQFLKLGSDAWRSEYRLSARAASGLSSINKAAIQKVVELEDRLGALGVSVVTAADAHYPASIEEMDSDPPGVLFIYGNARLLESKSFCVLSSRNSLPADLDLIEALTEQGVLQSEVLVTGHDRPEYQRSAVVPLRWGAPRILCLDRGMLQVLGPDLKDEAFRAARLWRYEFDPATDLVVSPFRPESDFIGVNNQVRDRLVGSLSRRLVFVQIAAGGNMERLARQALACGRRVQVSDRSANYRHLVQAGATLLP